jgi:steroid delta-isomerase-like uncharacterized protein
MSAAENKQLVEQAVAAFNRGDLDAYLASYADNAAIHGLPSDFAPTLDGHRRFLAAMRRGLPDMTADIDDIVAEGDRVAVRLTYRGTHLGELRGVAPTGRRITWQSMTFRRFDESGRTVERWILGDTLALLSQLGIVVHPEAGARG